LIGFAIGLALIFGQRLFYDKVPDKETIESLSETPVIGVIKKINMNESTNADYDLYIFKGPKSIFSESIRGIRSNINFLLKGENKKVICVTSTVSGEGKTFCTINLAAAFTLLNKKVLIVGCDLRRPKIHLSFKNMTNDIGLSTYLIGRNELHEVIIPSEYNNLYVIPAGPAPPNPAELLQTQKMKNLFTLLKEDFDYVLFDTAPVGLVSDSLELMKNADLNLYILRSQYSKRDFALIPDRLKADNQIQNIYTILNSYDASSAIYRSIYKNEYGGYYGGGGYYYYGGYYGKGSYGYYGRKYYSNYYSSYYSDEELQPKSFISRTISYFKKFIKK
jgi:capsular exopolysaccharide synthesis family protein